MRAYCLSLGLLGVVAVSLAACLEPWFAGWRGNRSGSANVLQVALGDGRKLFAKHIYVKADAYFHNGYYPSIYDRKYSDNGQRLTAAVNKGGDHKCEDSYLGAPLDWIDAFSRHFYPTRHTHLGAGKCNHDHGGHDHDHGEGGCEHCKTCEHDHGEAKPAKGDEREMLPWLRLSAELDPQRIETYVVSAYWLRSALGKVDEAEQFLRLGLQHNPADCELLFELGRIYSENRHDTARARNVWELAVRKWDERESGKAEPNIFLRAQLLGQLAKLEEAEKNYSRAIEHLTRLKVISPNKDSVQKWIDELKASQ